MNGNQEDEVWESIRREAEANAAGEPMLASFLYAVVLKHQSLEECLGFLLASKLESSNLTALSLRDLFDEALGEAPSIGESVRADLRAVVERDPACNEYSTPLLYFKGFQALQAYRVAHYFWNEGRHSLALYLQSRISDVFAVDIHPAARIGHGILMDHATGVVIGETSVIEHNVSILHAVTLGGTGKETGDRHPKIAQGVLLAAGAKILGNVKVGKGAKVAAGAVVLHDVPEHCTVAGVPATVVGRPVYELPALEMNQQLNSEDE